MQFRVTAGRASVDLRELARAQTVELRHANAAFTIERTGYYHAAVTEIRPRSRPSVAAAPR